jgi:hypothetical protein
MSNQIARVNIPGTKSRALLARRQEFVPRGISSTMNVFASKADGQFPQPRSWNCAN